MTVPLKKKYLQTNGRRRKSLLGSKLGGGEGDYDLVFLAQEGKGEESGNPVR